MLVLYAIGVIPESAMHQLKFGVHLQGLLSLMNLPKSWRTYSPLMVGGFLLGAGISLTGCVPGMVLIQAGAGVQKASWVLIGAVLGTFLYGYAENNMRRWLHRSAGVPTGGLAGGLQAPPVLFPGAEGEEFVEEVLGEGMEGGAVEETVTITQATERGVETIRRRTVIPLREPEIAAERPQPLPWVRGSELGFDFWSIVGFTVASAALLCVLEQSYPWQLELANILRTSTPETLGQQAWFQLHLPLWSPIEAGIMIGLLQIPCLLLTHSTLLTNMAYATAAGYLADKVDMNARRHAPTLHTRSSDTAREMWGAMFLVGAFLGAVISSYGSSAALLTGTLLANRVPRILALLGGTTLAFGGKMIEDSGFKMGLSGATEFGVSALCVGGGVFAGTVGTALML